MSESEEDVLVGEEATPNSLLTEAGQDQSKVHDQASTNHRDSQSCHSAEMNSALSRGRTDNEPNNAQASAATGSVSHGGAVDPQGPTVSHLPGDDIDGARRNQILREEGSSINPTCADLSTPATNRATSTTSTTSVASREGFSTSTPIGQHYPNQRSLGSTPDREYYGGGEEEEEEDWEELGGDGGMGNAAGSFLGYSQLVYENNMEDGDDGELEELVCAHRWL